MLRGRRVKAAKKGKCRGKFDSDGKDENLAYVYVRGQSDARSTSKMTPCFIHMQSKIVPCFIHMHWTCIAW